MEEILKFEPVLVSENHCSLLEAEYSSLVQGALNFHTSLVLEPLCSHPNTSLQKQLFFLCLFLK